MRLNNTKAIINGMLTTDIHGATIIIEIIAVRSERIFLKNISINEPNLESTEEINKKITGEALGKTLILC